MSEQTNDELIQAIRDKDKGLGEHAMLSARIIHNNVVVMQAAYLEAKVGKGDDVAMAWIENLLIDSDNVPEEEYGGAGDLKNAHDANLYFRDNRLDGELSPYQSRMAPLIDELARRLESVTAERDRLLAERAELERQEPVTFVFDPNGYAIDGKHTEIADALPTGTDLYTRPVPAPSTRLIHDVERCYRMLLTEPDTKGALFKAENLLREALADALEVTAAPAVPDANPVQWLEDEGDMILVPRSLLGAACSSIDKQRPAAIRHGAETMTNEEMLQEMRSKRGFRQFGPSKVQRMFGLHYNRAVEWIEWLVGFGLAERIDDRPWEVRLL